MATKRLTPLDLNTFELQNAIVQNLASAPTGIKGRLYFDTVSNILMWYNGTSWVQAQGSGAVSYGSPVASAVGDASADGVATTVSRSDHKHAREAFGAVTAQTAFAAASANGTATTVSHSDHTHGTPTHDNAAHSSIVISALSAPTADVAWGSHKITSLLDPTNPQDAATKAYVDAARAGLSVKDPARVVATANVTVSNPGTAVFDGVTLANGDRILLTGQTTGSENGLYVFNGSAAALTRTTDANTSALMVPGTAVWINEGTANGDTRWVLTTNAPITLGTTALTFTVDLKATSVTAGAGLTANAGAFAVGAGTGIVVGADTVGIDTTVVVRKYAQNVGDGSSTSITVTHNLGTQDVTVALYTNGSPYDEELPDIQHTTTNTITLIFGVAPAANAFRVVVHG